MQLTGQNDVKWSRWCHIHV